MFLGSSVLLLPDNVLLSGGQRVEVGRGTHALADGRVGIASVWLVGSETKIPAPKPYGNAR